MTNKEKEEMANDLEAVYKKWNLRIAATILLRQESDLSLYANMYIAMYIASTYPSLTSSEDVLSWQNQVMAGFENVLKRHGVISDSATYLGPSEN